MKPWAKKFYKSKAWLNCRAAYIKKVFGLCERCGQPGKIVHHKIYLNQENINKPEITLDFSNLEYLCQNCHNAEHPKYGTGRNICRHGLIIDETGNLIRAPGLKEGDL